MTSFANARSSPAPTSSEAGTVRRLSSAEAAWLAAVPTGLLFALAIYVVGPPLGRSLLSSGSVGSFSWWQTMMLPEPVEHARFVLAVVAPLALAAAIVAASRWSPMLDERRIATSVTAAQLSLLCFVVVCLLAQWQIGFDGMDRAPVAPTQHRDYFTPVTLLVAALGTAALIAVVAVPRARRPVARWLRDTKARRVGCWLLSACAIAVWLLHAFNTETTIATSHIEVDFHAMFTVDETFAVLNGLSPLVDFATQYAALWPYALALGMAVLDTSITVWVALALALSGASMLAAYAVLRRVARSGVGGLLLFLPVLATSFFAIDLAVDNRYTYANYYGAFPLRYAAPLLLAWLVARHLDEERPRGRVWLFALAGLIAFNGPDVGLPAVGATFAALLWTSGRVSWRALGRLGLALAGGLAIAGVLVSALTLARAGSLPDVGLLFRYSEIFASSGFGMVPMPALGLHIVIYLTYVAAIAVATARAMTRLRAEEKVLTGMLAWTAVLGLGAGAYYVGRSTPGILTATFSWWSLTLALLAVVAIRSLSTPVGRRQRLPIGQVACLFAFGVAACSLAQTPTPWSQLERLRSTGRSYAAPIGQTFVARHTRPGENVAILVLLGHRIGFNLDVTNVSPYTGTLSMPLHEQLDDVIAALRRADGRKVFLTPEHTGVDFRTALATSGFTLASEDQATAMEMWVDTTTR